MPLVNRLSKDQVTVTSWSGIPDSLTVELMARLPQFDAITLDMQHGGHHEDSVARSMPAVRLADTPCIVRIPVGRFDMASRALDMGADAVIAPMVNSADDARHFAAAMKYPPMGERSWGPTFALGRQSAAPQDFMLQANARCLSFAMIETTAALDALDDILAVPGIDAVFVGPSDFSIAWTKGAALDPLREDMMPVLADIARRARAAGKHAGIFVMDPDIAGRYVQMGYRLLALGTEGQLLAHGAESVVGRVRASITG